MCSLKAETTKAKGSFKLPLATLPQRVLQIGTSPMQYSPIRHSLHDTVMHLLVSSNGQLVRSRLFWFFCPFLHFSRIHAYAFEIYVK